MKLKARFQVEKEETKHARREWGTEGKCDRNDIAENKYTEGNKKLRKQINKYLTETDK